MHRKRWILICHAISFITPLASLSSLLILRHFLPIKIHINPLIQRSTLSRKLRMFVLRDTFVEITHHFSFLLSSKAQWRNSFTQWKYKIVSSNFFLFFFYFLFLFKYKYLWKQEKFKHELFNHKNKIVSYKTTYFSRK